MESNEPKQVFVRNDKGKVWGPLALPTVELLIDNSLIDGKLQVSEDGVNFAFPGRFPGIRRVFPRELWGDVVAPGNPEDDLPPPVVMPPQMAEEGAPAAAPGAPGGLLAGPGAVAAAARAAAGGNAPPGGPVAGPGARQVPGRPVIAPGQARRPPPVIGAPPGQGAPPPGVRPAPARPGTAPPPVIAAPEPPPALAPELDPEPTTDPEAEALQAEPEPPAIELAASDAEPEAEAKPPPKPAAPPVIAPQPMTEAGAAPPSRGELATTSAIHLYYLAAASELTGLLTLKLSDRNIEIHFRKGNPEYVGSSHPEDSVGAFLLSKGLATPQQISQAEGALDQFGGELIGALFGLGILNPGTAFQGLAQRAGTLLSRALHAERGTFTFEAKELSAGKVMPLGNRWGLLTEQVRRLAPMEMRRRLGEELDLPVMKSGGRVQASDLKLTPQETRALGHIDGVRSLRQLMKDMPQDADHFVRLAFLLRELEIVSFAAVPNRPAPPPSSEPEPEPAVAPVAAAPPKAAAAPPPSAMPKISTPAGAPAAGPGAKPAAPKPPAASPRPPPVMTPKPAEAPPVAAVSPEEEIKQLQATAAKVKEQNFFEVLGLTDKADGGAVKMAYFKLAKVFHPDTVPPGAPADLGRLKAEIFGKIGDAYRMLGDDKSRANYIEDLKAGGGNADKVDIAQIFAAEEKFAKGQILIKARKFPEAVKMLDEAIAGNSEEGEFYAWRGYAKFFTQHDKKMGQVEALKDINICLKKNERCAQAHYFIGQMAKLCGDPDAAKKSFKKCLQIAPDHLDAQREIRMYKK